jgi:hypothetical protein
VSSPDDARDARLAAWEAQVGAAFRYREWVERVRTARSKNATLLRGFQLVAKIRESGYRETTRLVVHRIRREIAERRG